MSTEIPTVQTNGEPNPEGDPMVTAGFSMGEGLYDSFVRTADRLGLLIYTGDKRLPILISRALRVAFSEFLDGLDAGEVEIPERAPIEEGETKTTTIRLSQSVYRKMTDKAEPLGMTFVDPSSGRIRIREHFYKTAMRYFIKRNEGNPRR